MRASVVTVAVRRAADGRSVVHEASGTEPWRPRILADRDADGVARVALVQSRASLLTGDDVRLDVTVGEGAALELVELGAMVVHHARGGAEGRLTVRATVGQRGLLVWLGQPLIVADGARAVSDVGVSLAREAVAVRGEGVVMGRVGDAGTGSLRARLRVERCGRPLIEETLDTGTAAFRSAVVAGEAGMIGAVSLAGMRDEHVPVPDGTMQAHGPATIWRGAGDSLEVGAAAADVAARWRALALSYFAGWPLPAGSSS